MKILVLNCGSSSVKYALFQDMNLLNGGLIERVENHYDALCTILGAVGDIDGVGHRVVHGGEKYQKAVIIDKEVCATIQELIALAPLHNRANLAGIEAVRQLSVDIPQVAVFDTSFHQSMPPHAFMYALPYSLYLHDKIRKYGFHGTSHNYILKETARKLCKPIESINMISFHLGNGNSACAIQNGKSIDTTMGFTPLEGLIMGTRCGDIDPEILVYLQTKKGLTIDEIEKILNKESGLKGICGVSDMRDVAKLAYDNDPRATLAIEMFCYHAKKYLGAYLVILGRVDAITFTGGIGEHASFIRAKILENLENFGIILDEAMNSNDSTQSYFIHKDGSKVALVVVHTDEEREIALETMNLLK